MATSGTELASAIIALRVKMPGVQNDVNKALGGVDSSQAGEKVGSRFAAGLQKAIKVGAVAAGAAVAAIGVAGFKSAAGIEKSQKVLGGLYGDAALATKTMRELRDVTVKSPIDASAYDKAAQSLAYAGITGKDAVGTLKNVGLAITAAGGDSVQLEQATGGIMKAVNNGGIAMMDSLSMISESGVPILSGLAAKFETTTDQIKKMASAGEISLTDVMDVMQNGMGDTFQQMMSAGKEAEGSFANTWKASKDAVIDAVGQTMVPIFTKLTPLVSGAGEAVVKFVTEIRTGEGPGGRFADTVQRIWSAVSGFIGVVTTAVAAVVGWVSSNRDWLSALGVAAGVITGVIAVTRTARAITLGWTAAVKGAQIATYLTGGALKVYTALIAGKTAAIKVATLAQKAWNYAMKTNPIGVIITAISALVAGIVYWVTQTESGQAVWAAFMSFLGTAWAWLKRAFFVVVEAFRLGWEQISTAVSTAYNTYIKPVFDAIGAAASWLFTTILQPLFNGFMVVWNFAWGLLVGTYEAIIKPILDGIGALFNWLWTSVIQIVFLSIQGAIIGFGVVMRWLNESIVQPVIKAVGAVWNWLYTKVIQPVILGIRIYIQVWATAIRWLYNNVIKPVFNAVAAVFRWIYNNIIMTIVNLIKSAIRGLGAAFTWLYGNAIKPAIDGVGRVMNWLLTGVVQPIWNSIKFAIATAWAGIKKIIDTLVKVVKSDPKNAFEAAKNGIIKAWDKIKEAAKKPIRFVVDTALGGLIDALNKIPLVNITKPKLPAGFRTGGYTGNAGINEVAGVVHGREHVTRAESTAKLNRNHPGLLDHMNRYGTLPGYRKGGWVTPLPAGSYSVSQPFHSGHNGIDLAAATGTKVMAPAAGRVVQAGWEPGGSFGGGNQVNILHPGNILTWFAHLNTIAARVGQQVSRGRTLGGVGSTGNSTGPHLHYMIETGSSGALGSGNWINPAPYMTGHTAPQGGVGDKSGWNPLAGIVDWVSNKIKDAFPDGGMFVDAALGLAKDTAKKAVDKYLPKWGKDDTGSAFAPMLYDGGGLLQPGLTLTNNKTGRPEPILTGAQWDSLVGSRSGSAGPVTVFIGDREFEGWMDDRADGRIDAANENAARTGRLTRMGSV